MKRNKKLFIGLITLFTILGVCLSSFLFFVNVDTSNNFALMNEKEKKAFNDVKMIENSLITRKGSLNNIGTSLNENEAEQLRKIINENYTLAELQVYQNSDINNINNFKKYSTKELIQSNLFGGYYDEQFIDSYSDEEYYINLESEIVLPTKGRKIDGYQKEVFVKPEVIEEAPQEDGEDINNYPKFTVTKINNLNYLVTINFHDKMEVKEYLIGDEENGIWKTAENSEVVIKITENTTINTRYKLSKNDNEYIEGNKKEINNLCLSQAECQKIKDEKYAITFIINESDNNNLQANFPGSSIAVICEGGFIPKDSSLEKPEKWENPDKESEFFNKIGNKVTIKEDETGNVREGTYFLNLRTSVISNSKEKINISDSKERIVKIVVDNSIKEQEKEENKKDEKEKTNDINSENKDDNETKIENNENKEQSVNNEEVENKINDKEQNENPNNEEQIENESNEENNDNKKETEEQVENEYELYDSLYDTDIKELNFEFYDKNGSTVENDEKYKIIGENQKYIEENEIVKEFTLEECVNYINVTEGNIDIQGIIDDNCTSIKSLFSVLGEKIITEGNEIVWKIKDDKVVFKLGIIKNNETYKTIQFNFIYKKDVKENDILANDLSFVVLNNGEEYSTVSTIRKAISNNEESKISLNEVAKYITEQENPVIYYEVDQKCTSVRIKSNQRVEEITSEKWEIIKEEEKLIGKLEKEIDVKDNNNNVKKLKIIVYKNIEENYDNIFFDESTINDLIVGNEKKINLCFEGNLDTDKIEYKLVNVSSISKEANSQTKIAEVINTKKLENENKIEYSIKAISAGKVRLEIYSKDNNELLTQSEIIILPKVDIEDNTNLEYGEKKVIAPKIDTGIEKSNLESNEKINVDFSTADSTIATVNSSGELKGISEGTTEVKGIIKTELAYYIIKNDENIIASRADAVTENVEIIIFQSKFFNTITVDTKEDESDNIAIRTITNNQGEVIDKFIKVLVTNIDIKENSLTLENGESKVVTTVIQPDEAYDKTLNWSTSNASVATVKNGKITAKGVGSATITAKANDGSNKSDTISVVVNQSPEKIDITNNPKVLNNGSTFDLKYEIKPDSTNRYKEVSWSSSDENIISVDKNGKISCKGIGTAEISVKTQNNKKDSISITVKEQVTKINANNLYLNSNGEGKLNYSVEPKGANSKVKIINNNSDIVKIDNKGNVKAVSVGVANVTIESIENNNIKTNIIITVNKCIHTPNLYKSDCTKDMVCTKCGEVLQKATGKHTYGEWEVVIEPTCEAGGKRTRTCSKCGYGEEEVMYALGHDEKGKDKREATCSEEGYTTCSMCGKKNTIEKKGHEFSSEVRTVEATCETTGYTYQICKNCSETKKLSEIAVNHTFGNWKITKNPSCEKSGEKTRECTKCGYDEVEKVEALGHEYNNILTEAATCTKKGYTYYKCKNCENRKKIEDIPTIAHDDKGEDKKTATCVSEGYTTCSMCGKKKTIAKKAHEYNNILTEAGTCTTRGYTYYKCKNCDAQKIIAYTPVTHTYGAWKKVIEPTCEAGGKRIRTCTKCGVAEEEGIDALGHNENGAKSPVTCNYDGYTTCSNCGRKKIIKATGHKYGAFSITKAATCTASGTKTKKCSNCGYKVTETISATGHSWGSWSTVRKATCTVAGTQTRKCSKCSNSQTQSISATGHSWGSWSTTKNATCTVAGTKTRVCKNCNSKEIQTISATGHSWGSWSTARKATCTVAGTQTRKCSKCGNSQTQSTGLASHTYGFWGSAKALFGAKPTCKVCGKKKS